MKQVKHPEEAELFTLPPRPERPKLAKLCPPGKELAAAYEAMLESVRQNPTELTIQFALLALLEKYWFSYGNASKAHKDHLGTRNGHTCLHQVFHFYYKILQGMLLKVNPPLRPQALPPAKPEPRWVLGEGVSGP